MAMRTPKGGIRNEMREKAVREVILAQLGALRADAGVEQVACKDESVGDYLAGKTDALVVAMQMWMWQSKARIYEGKAAGYMAAARVVTEVREANKYE